MSEIGADRPLPKLLYSVDDVAAMFGKTADRIRDLCFERKIPYRLERYWYAPGRCTKKMVFSMLEIQVALDHFAPPVNQLLERGRRPRRAGRTEAPPPADAARGD